MKAQQLSDVIRPSLLLYFLLRSSARAGCPEVTVGLLDMGRGSHFRTGSGQSTVGQLASAPPGAFPEFPAVTSVPFSLVGTVSHDCLLSRANCCL